MHKYAAEHTVTSLQWTVKEIVFLKPCKIPNTLLAFPLTIAPISAAYYGI